MVLLFRTPTRMGWRRMGNEPYIYVRVPALGLLSFVVYILFTTMSHKNPITFLERRGAKPQLVQCTSSSATRLALCDLWPTSASGSPRSERRPLRLHLERGRQRLGHWQRVLGVRERIAGWQRALAESRKRCETPRFPPTVFFGAEWVVLELAISKTMRSRTSHVIRYCSKSKKYAR